MASQQPHTPPPRTNDRTSSFLSSTLCSPEVQGWSLPPEIVSWIVRDVVLDFKTDNEAQIVPLLLVCRAVTDMALPHLYREIYFCQVEPLKSFLIHSPPPFYHRIQTLTLQYMFPSHDGGLTRCYNGHDFDDNEWALETEMAIYRARVRAYLSECKAKGVVTPTEGRAISFRSCHPSFLGLYCTFPHHKLTVENVHDPTGASWRSPLGLSPVELHFSSTHRNIHHMLWYVFIDPSTYKHLRHVTLTVAGYSNWNFDEGSDRVRLLLTELQAFAKRSPDVEGIKLDVAKGGHFFCPNGMASEMQDFETTMEDLDPRIELVRCPKDTCPFDRRRHDAEADDPSQSEPNTASFGAEVSPLTCPSFTDLTSEALSDEDEDDWELEQGELEDIEGQFARFIQNGGQNWAEEPEFD